MSRAPQLAGREAQTEPWLEGTRVGDDLLVEPKEVAPAAAGAEHALGDGAEGIAGLDDVDCVALARSGARREIPGFLEDGEEIGDRPYAVNGARRGDGAGPRGRRRYGAAQCDPSVLRANGDLLDEETGPLERAGDALVECRTRRLPRPPHLRLLW